MVIGSRVNSKNNDRRFTGGGPRPDNKENKCEEATQRAARWTKLSPVQQLKELDDRLGEGVGAQKQRARLRSQIESAKNKQVNAPSQNVDATSQSQGERIKAKDRRAQQRQERWNK